MRTLTILRRKSFVACAAKMKLYIEDHECGSLMIGGVPCRLLGTLKNGEEVSFEIGFDAAKLFVVGDKLTRNLFNECYPLPEGTDDLHLSGKNHYNPSVGNPFFFDGVSDPEVLAKRKKQGRNGLRIIVLAAILGLAIGLVEPLSVLWQAKQPKDFSAGGMTITLNGSFDEVELEDFTAAYENRDTAVFVLKEEFALAEGFGELSLAEYGELLIAATPSAEGVQLQESDGLTWFEYEYTNPESMEDYAFLSCLYKSKDAFWFAQFVTNQDGYDAARPRFMEWAQSVRFE